MGLAHQGRAVLQVETLKPLRPVVKAPVFSAPETKLRGNCIQFLVSIPICATTPSQLQRNSLPQTLRRSWK